MVQPAPARERIEAQQLRRGRLEALHEICELVDLPLLILCRVDPSVKLGPAADDRLVQAVNIDDRRLLVDGEQYFPPQWLRN